MTNFINKERLYSFEKARSLRPQKSNYPREIGHIQFLLGNHKKAAEILLEAIKLNPSDTVDFSLFNVTYLNSWQLQDMAKFRRHEKF